MSEVSYYGIELALKDLLDRNLLAADFGGRKPVVECENKFMLNTAKLPYVYFALTGWETPEDRTTIGGLRPFST